MTKKPAKRRRRISSYSALADHKHIGTSLVPPLLQVPNVQFTSWMNEQVPELLWATLIITTFPRVEALDSFRKIAFSEGHHRDQKDFCTGVNHSDLALTNDESFYRIVSGLLAHPRGYIALRPLLLFNKLPGYKRWAQMLNVEPFKSDWDTVTRAIARTIDHQSQEATDCRWLSVLFQMAMGLLYFPEDKKQLAKEIMSYPDKGDITKLRPSVRALEGCLRNSKKTKSPWPEDFWRTCFENTCCLRFASDAQESVQSASQISLRIKEIGVELDRHFYRTVATTAVDPRHDACFGFAKYALSILTEVLLSTNCRAIVGRLGLRATVEIFITFAYLAKKHDEQLWSNYRSFGSGQAKLAFLKLEEAAGSLPSYVDKRTLENLANEDIFQEFLSINIGHWGKKDLRILAQDSGCKDIYDAYYNWTSAYTHGNWGSIRDSVFETCYNPLHRFHRLLRSERRFLEDVIPDVCSIVNRILDLLDHEYPEFKERIGS